MNSPIETRVKPAIGFWKCWSMAVGVMIGSGVFLLPASLAPYGGVSFLGWLLTSVGAILIALSLGRLAGRTERTGGPYVYAQKAFGDLTGFLVAWGYWLGVVFATTAIAVAFAGYAGALAPMLGASPLTQGAVAAGLIVLLTLINLKGVAEAASMQLVMTILKLVPLFLIVLVAIFAGSPENLPPLNPSDAPFGKALAATALLTMWAFLGLECAVIPAGDVENPTKTMPRAIVTGTIFVAVLYIASTAAVMFLLPIEKLAVSTAPFADAAYPLGAIGAPLIAIGAIISTAGSANGNILMSGQMPLAVALDGLAPKALARRNAGNSPALALILSSALSIALLAFNYQEGLVAAFTFLITMSTLGTLAPYLVSAVAEFKYSWRSAKGWAAIALLAVIYSLIAMLGAGLKTLLWGAVLMLAGLPVFYWVRRKKTGQA
ncbi:amino acid permease [Hyphococcus flavus]|uniref:Arginine/agmatine antiporter n=1 Tax=Hyphococcus flavus TaxID=1866326 RepID=A0AAE9ZA27_9PROT|nr:amino acid permease [Hyphococcus flavus]WDI30324.1 amino acid permease [Hyphococcus flavus]